VVANREPGENEEVRRAKGFIRDLFVVRIAMGYLLLTFKHFFNFRKLQRPHQTTGTHSTPTSHVVLTLKIFARSLTIAVTLLSVTICAGLSSCETGTLQ